MGTGEKRRCIGHEDKNNRRCYVLNDFYACFECHDFSEARNNLTDRPTSTPVEDRGERIAVREDEVLRQLQRKNSNKAAAPDGIEPSILKYFADQQCSILCYFKSVFRSVQNTAHVEDIMHNDYSKEVAC